MLAVHNINHAAALVCYVGERERECTAKRYDRQKERRDRTREGIIVLTGCSFEVTCLSRTSWLRMCIFTVRIQNTLHLPATMYRITIRVKSLVTKIPAVLISLGQAHSPFLSPKKRVCCAGFDHWREVLSLWSTRQVRLAVPPSVTVTFWTIGNWLWAPGRQAQRVKQIVVRCVHKVTSWKKKLCCEWVSEQHCISAEHGGGLIKDEEYGDFNKTPVVLWKHHRMHFFRKLFRMLLSFGNLCYWCIACKEQEKPWLWYMKNLGCGTCAASKEVWQHVP